MLTGIWILLHMQLAYILSLKIVAYNLGYYNTAIVSYGFLTVIR